MCFLTLGDIMRIPLKHVSTNFTCIVFPVLWSPLQPAMHACNNKYNLRLLDNIL